MRQILTHSSQIGKIIAARRRAMKLTQRSLASKLGISQNRLSVIEANPATLSVERLLEISNVLRLQIIIQDRSYKDFSSESEW